MCPTLGMTSLNLQNTLKLVCFQFSWYSFIYSRLWNRLLFIMYVNHSWQLISNGTHCWQHGYKGRGQYCPFFIVLSKGVYWYHFLHIWNHVTRDQIYDLLHQTRLECFLPIVSYQTDPIFTFNFLTFLLKTRMSQETQTCSWMLTDLLVRWTD